MASIDRHYFSVCTVGYKQSGGNPNRLLREVGINPSHLDRPGWRGSVEAMAALVQRISQEMDDLCLGFTPNVTPLEAYAFGVQLAIEGHSVADGLKRMIRFSNLVNQDIQSKMTEENDGLSISVELGFPELDPDHYFSEFTMMSWHRLSCWLAGETIPMISASFDYSRPDKYYEEFKYLFPCNHIFKANRMCIKLDHHILHAPIRKTTASLRKMIYSAPLELMTIPSFDASLHRRIRQLLVQNPAQSTSDIAEQIKLTTDQIRHHLRSEGYSISKIREFVRRDMAAHWLKTSNRSIEHLADDLGYAEARSFTRAFRRWTKKSPSQFRKESIND